MPITDWDDAYANAAHIPGAETFLSDWPERSRRLREAHAPERLIYGSGARQTIDLYRPKTASQGLTVIVHGGYWMRFSPAEFGFLAAGPLAHGQSVAVVSYTLAPDARIAAITAEVARAVTMAAAAVPGPIRLTGHSAGGILSHAWVVPVCCKPRLPRESPISFRCPACMIYARFCAPR